MSKQKRVLAVASGGGHWAQLCRLLPAWDGCDVTYITTHDGFGPALTAALAARGEGAPVIHVVQEANRWEKLKLVKTLLQMIWIVVRVRPDVVVTTGAAPGYLALRLGKLLGARGIWVDSIANAEELSLSGRMAGKHADLWLTQWEHLASGTGETTKNKTRAPGYRGAVL